MHMQYQVVFEGSAFAPSLKEAMAQGKNHLPTQLAVALGVVVHNKIAPDRKSAILVIQNGGERELGIIRSMGILCDMIGPEPSA